MRVCVVVVAVLVDHHPSLTKDTTNDGDKRRNTKTTASNELNNVTIETEKKREREKKKEQKYRTRFSITSTSTYNVYLLCTQGDIL